METMYWKLVKDAWINHKMHKKFEENFAIELSKMRLIMKLFPMKQVLTSSSPPKTKALKEIIFIVRNEA